MEMERMAVVVAVDVILRYLTPSLMGNHATNPVAEMQMLHAIIMGKRATLGHSVMIYAMKGERKRGKRKYRRNPLIVALYLQSTMSRLRSLMLCSPRSMMGIIF